MTPIISADSHITEAPGTYVDRIDTSVTQRLRRTTWRPLVEQDADRHHAAEASC